MNFLQRFFKINQQPSLISQLKHFENISFIMTGLFQAIILRKCIADSSKSKHLDESGNRVHIKMSQTISKPFRTTVILFAFQFYPFHVFYADPPFLICQLGSFRMRLLILSSSAPIICNHLWSQPPPAAKKHFDKQLLPSFFGFEK